MTTPASWPKVRLGDIGQSLIGLTYSPNNVKRSGTLVLRSSNIQDERLSLDDNVYVDSAIPERLLVRENDILICVRNGSRRLIGKSVLLDRRVAGETFGAFMAVYRSDANPFLRYFFQSDDFKAQIDEHLGATINQITNGSLNSFTVALPGPSEQATIVAKLSDIDTLIAALERLIAKKKAIKQGMMQQLLTGRTRLPGFDMEWRRTTLELLSDQHRRTIDPRKENARQFQHFSLPSFDDGELPVHEPGSAIDSIKFLVPPQAVLVSKLNPRIPRIWAPNDIGPNSIASTEFIVMTPKSGTNRSFLKWIMKSDPITSRMKLLATGTTGSHARIHSRQVSSLEVSVPHEAEQAEIATVLDDAEREIELVDKRLTKAQATKTGMMQQLLTGRTRLPVEADHECR
ncbi:restriction endonuclease subunit S [Rhodococcus pyridinivorans]|uniref:restriction endonuclease subunit S n=1 Tax=Rhodococcus pyridinivorans TaxID=103816 RepID=UPI003AAC5257